MTSVLVLDPSKHRAFWRYIEREALGFLRLPSVLVRLKQLIKWLEQDSDVNRLFWNLPNEM